MNVLDKEAQLQSRVVDLEERVKYLENLVMMQAPYHVLPQPKRDPKFCRVCTSPETGQVCPGQSGSIKNLKGLMHSPVAEAENVPL